MEDSRGGGRLEPPVPWLWAWLPWGRSHHLKYQLSLSSADHSFPLLSGSQLCRDCPGIIRTPLRPDLLHEMHRHPQLVQVHQAPVSTSLGRWGQGECAGPSGLTLMPVSNGDLRCSAEGFLLAREAHGQGGPEALGNDCPWGVPQPMRLMGSWWVNPPAPSL